MQLEDEAGALGEGGVEVEVAIHTQGHLFADRQSETIALGEVVNLEEGLEEVVALLLGNALTRVGYKELMTMLSALLIFEGYFTTLRSVFYGIL